MIFRKHYTDQELVNGIVEGKREILNYVYDNYFEAVRKNVLKNSGNEHDARETFNEALLAISRKKNVEMTSTFAAYLTRICRNKWIDELRKRKRNTINYVNWEGTIVQIEHEPEDESEHREALIKQIIDRNMEILGEPCKSLIVARYVQELPLKDIGNINNMIPNTVGQKIGRCIAKLQELIRADAHFKKLFF